METVTSRDPEVQGGVPVFRHTRVPVHTLFDFLEAGDSLDEFLREFPSVTRAQAIQAIDEAKDALLVGSDAATPG